MFFNFFLEICSFSLSTIATTFATTTDVRITFPPVRTASLAPLGALIGGLFSSLPLSHLGRKRTLLISAVMFFLAFIVLGASSEIESYAVILGCRGLMGFAVGLTIPAAQIYVRLKS